MENKILSIIMAMLAYTCISAGFVLMKKGISWIGWKEKKNSKYFKYLFIWISGLVIMNIYGIPSAIALKNLPAHIVAAFAGWGIISLVFLSYFFLKEKVYISDYIFSLIIVFGIVLLNVYEKPVSQQKSNTVWILILCVIPVFLFLISFVRSLSLKIKTILFASVSGISAGLMVIFLGLLVFNFKYEVILYFGSSYLYLYIGYALLSFLALQMALKKGVMMVIGPVQYSTNIIYPLFASLLIHNRQIILIQYFAVILIVYSVSKLLKNH